MRLYAAELFWLRSDRRNLFPVHTTTELEALAWYFEKSTIEAERRALVLQAPAWLAEVRERIVDDNGAYVDGPTIERLPGSEATLADACATRSTPAAAAALEREPEALAAFLARLRDELVPRADQDHQHKFLAVVHEESARSHPRWRALIAAPAIDCLPGAESPRTDFARRARAVLESAGV